MSTPLSELIERIKACRPSHNPTADQILETRKAIDDLTEADRADRQVDYYIGKFAEYEIKFGPIRVVDYVWDSNGRSTMVLRHPSHPRVAK